MSEQEYVQPAYHFRMRGGIPKPGPIKGTKKEWAICRICKTLFVRRRIEYTTKPHVTCQAPACVNTNNRINHTRYMKKWKQNNPEKIRNANAKYWQNKKRAKAQ